MLNSLLNKIGYQKKPLPALEAEFKNRVIEEEFWNIYNQCREYTMTSPERMYSLYKAVKYVVQAKLEGDFVECGVWKGGSAMVIAYTLKALRLTDRDIFLYDTFEGMSEPTEHDMKNSTVDGNHVRKYWEEQQKGGINEWCYSSLDEVRSNLERTGYPMSQIHTVKGKVEDSIPNTIPKKISLLRLDTDWYESTKHELMYLYPILTDKGVLIIDDYGSWAGAKKAVDEFFADTPILLNRVDTTGRIGVK
ncbi:MAG: macrocin O-methyltransferase [Bacteroidetes bacterium]|nr:macrocin O-methyltransferase [Bacteroidota bacterium]